ncbi:MAG TPA: hypothetical protein PLA50_15140, partial [Bacteroidia bacterium]|nr:hypothetical protein [Bacteroidia bacterium]
MRPESPAVSDTSPLTNLAIIERRLRTSLMMNLATCAIFLAVVVCHWRGLLHASNQAATATTSIATIPKQPDFRFSFL